MATSKIVWTSDPEEARRLRDSGRLESKRDAEPAAQTIRIAVDRKRRAGKTVTVANGFAHSAETLSRLATQLKKRCGSGGTAKDNEIEIQGDHAETVAAELMKMGYRVKRV
ncbi:MAG TPA: translation initiation factor [Thermoanaerobaculia bacterium]|nr:translation initiation factor [Thermoanaerobaculia bacterium]